MILSDFISRQTHNDSNLHEIIPISFNMYNTLYENYYSIEIEDQYLVQMRSQTKATGITLLEVHSTKKMLDTNILAEKQEPHIHKKQVDINRPRLGRGRAGIKCKKNPYLFLTQLYQQVNHLKYLQLKMLLKRVWLSQYQNN